MRYTNLSLHLDRAAKGLSEQEGGTHADEIETSMMLYIDPSSVDMSKAVKDYTLSTGQRSAQPAARRDRYLFAQRQGDPTRASAKKDGSSKRWLRTSTTCRSAIARCDRRLPHPQRNPRDLRVLALPHDPAQTVPIADAGDEFASLAHGAFNHCEAVAAQNWPRVVDDDPSIADGDRHGVRITVVARGDAGRIPVTRHAVLTRPMAGDRHPSHVTATLVLCDGATAKVGGAG